MPDLFTLAELEAYAQKTVPPATFALALELVTTEVRRVATPARYDALADVSVFKPVALELGKRMVTNPGGIRSTARQIDDYSVTDTYASETIGATSLTAEEEGRIRAAVGLTAGGAFTIRPAAPTSRCAPTWRRC
ncbi:hypothetical protein OOJ91_13740 [Micromonospora lupini]|uniref:hypothetical protein n=1 Tax=Micromonospora lupini TaxID=285679 RepID=UPI0022553D06|nr:hypothetical protein [Micromonospora lupini]MCX5066909.1 hypothetical protein [Micromonospora lupini]